MTNEEFQNIVLKELKGLGVGQERLEKKVDTIQGQVDVIQKQVDVIQEQTAFLTEFRTEANEKLDNLTIESEILQEIVGRHEVSIRSIRRKIG